MIKPLKRFRRGVRYVVSRGSRQQEVIHLSDFKIKTKNGKLVCHIFRELGVKTKAPN
jgi:hypothetical protein